MPEDTENNTLSSLKVNYTFKNNSKLKRFYEELEDLGIGDNGFSDKIISHEFNDQNVKGIFYCFSNFYDKINFVIRTSDDISHSPEILSVEKEGDYRDDAEEVIFAIFSDTNFKCKINIYEVEKIKKMKLLFD
ncbi:PIR Superfamily Protein [Plasmodium ovale curtisi]|uniref:PIR Superfamily Protein n=1 Tax=Plasmodium ovale curtisi TaxID=864141 RepID=A0A1A8W9U7_PLAOA|nr:PIR Superfamily Protein [Plasmodium ovale curtisi]